MADILTTLLGTESTVFIFEELLVVQVDIRSTGKIVDTLLMEFDQQAFEAYLSSGSKGFAAGRTRRTPKIGGPIFSLVHATNSNSAKQSREAGEGPRRDFPQVVGGL